MEYPKWISWKGKTARLLSTKKKSNLFSSTSAFSFCEIVALIGVLKKKKLKKSQKYITLGDILITTEQFIHLFFFNSYLYIFFHNIFPITLLIPQVFNPFTHSFVNTFPCYSEYNWQHLRMNLFQLSPILFKLYKT